MKWPWPFRARKQLSEAILGRQHRWSQLPTPKLTLPFSQASYIVIDLETSGLDTRRDRLISIGAVRVAAKRICYEDCFHVVLQQHQTSDHDNILIHGITPTTQREGTPPVEALMAFWEFAGKSPLVAYHAPFDQQFLLRSTHQQLDIRPKSKWLDLAWLLPAVFTNTVPNRSPLDKWLAHFQLAEDGRHTADADALATAELLLMSLTQAEKKGLTHFDALFTLANGEMKLAPGGGF